MSLRFGAGIMDDTVQYERSASSGVVLVRGNIVQKVKSIIPF